MIEIRHKTLISDLLRCYIFPIFPSNPMVHSMFSKICEKDSLKPNIQKTKIMASGPITSWEIDGETVSDFWGGGAPKSLQMMIAAMKLKDTYSLEGKL